MSRVWTWSIVVFWVIAMGLLFRDKVLPGLLQSYYPIYSEGMAPPEEEDVQMGIFQEVPNGEVRIGTSRKSVSPWQPQHPEDTAWSIHDETTVELPKTFNLAASLTLRTTTLLDARLHVKTYDATISTALGDFVVLGVMKDETTLVVQVQSPLLSAPEERELKVSSATALASGLSPISPPADLRIGREWTVNSVDPMAVIMEKTVSTRPLIARVEKMEVIRIMGQDRTAFVVSLRGDRYQALIWVDERGKILQERVPVSGAVLIMRREPVTR